MIPATVTETDVRAALRGLSLPMATALVARQDSTGNTWTKPGTRNALVRRGLAEASGGSNWFTRTELGWAVRKVLNENNPLNPHGVISMIVHVCEVVAEGVDGHGRHAAGSTPLPGQWDACGMKAIMWREPRADDPVVAVLAASCPISPDVWELCATTYGSFLIRKTESIRGERTVWESWRREDDEEPMRALFEQIMAGEAR